VHAQLDQPRSQFLGDQLVDVRLADAGGDADDQLVPAAVLEPASVLLSTFSRRGARR
jgi:hypothetical protein